MRKYLYVYTCIHMYYLCTICMPEDVCVNVYVYMYYTRICRSLYKCAHVRVCMHACIYVCVSKSVFLDGKFLFLQTEGLLWVV